MGNQNDSFKIIIPDLNTEDKELIKTFQQNPRMNLTSKEYNSLLKIFFTHQTELYPINDKHLFQFKKNIEKLREKIYSIKKEVSPEKYYSLSCILGAFLGDSLGSYCEFKSLSLDNSKLIYTGDNIFGKPPGQTTDDSEMALSMAFAIMDNNNLNEINSNINYYYYGCWLYSKPFDIGNTTYNALKFFNFGYNIGDNILDKCEFNDKVKNSIANGFLMRISPFVIWFYYMFNASVSDALKSDNKVIFYELFLIIKSQGSKDNICTHPNKSNHSYTALFVFLALTAMFGYHPEIILNKFLILLSNEFIDECDKKAAIKTKSILNDFKKKDFNKHIYFSSIIVNMGLYIHSYELTLYYLTFFNEYKEDPDNNYSLFRVIMNEICNFGGDTDTNCTIVATVLGPIIGFDNFGEELKILLNHIPDERIQYTNALVYYYIDFLEKEFEEDAIIDNNDDYSKNEQIRYYTLYVLLNILFNDINDL